MEFEDVSQEIKREARRVATAFGVRKWEGSRVNGSLCLCEYGGLSGEIPVQWRLGLSPHSLVQLLDIEVGNYETACRLFDGEESMIENDGKFWTLHDSQDAAYNELMARGLYCLGFADQGMWQALGITLSAHEKLELRLSLPREFWPKRWLEEEAL